MRGSCRVPQAQFQERRQFDFEDASEVHRVNPAYPDGHKPCHDHFGPMPTDLLRTRRAEQDISDAKGKAKGKDKGKGKVKDKGTDK